MDEHKEEIKKKKKGTGEQRAKERMKKEGKQKTGHEREDTKKE
jgi:hypothetical protein